MLWDVVSTGVWMAHKKKNIASFPALNQNLDILDCSYSHPQEGITHTKNLRITNLEKNSLEICWQ